MNEGNDTRRSNVPNHEVHDNKIEQAIRDVTERIVELFRRGNRRRFELKSSQGRTIFGLPLILAAIIALFLLWRVPLLLVIAVVVALVVKAQFVLTRESDGEIVDPDRN